MRRTLSSPLTFFYKFVFPAGIIGAGLVFAVGQFLGKFRRTDEPPMTGLELLLFIGCLAVITAIMGAYAKSLKRIRVDGRTLYVSNYLKEISIPLSAIVDVTESASRRYFSLSIHLEQPSAFGAKIVFRPRWRLYWSGTHPLVQEIKAMVEPVTPGEAGNSPKRGL